MRATHRLTKVLRCPTGLQEFDIVEIEVATDGQIAVEEIQEAVDELGKEPIFQEAFTVRLAKRLEATIRTVSRHDRIESTVEESGEAF